MSKSGTHKPIAEMTREELGALFPIIIAEPNPDWPRIFNAERELLEAHIDRREIVRIEHIGSTAVPNLAAKPTIDILLDVAATADIPRLTETIIACDYQCVPQPKNPAPHLMFTKGYTPDGFRGQAFHIHVRYPGDWDEIYFRDYLRAHPETAREYLAVKRRLAAEFTNDREAYTDGKTAFITGITKLAKIA